MVLVGCANRLMCNTISHPTDGYTSTGRELLGIGKLQNLKPSTVVAGTHIEPNIDAVLEAHLIGWNRISSTTSEALHISASS